MVKRFRWFVSGAGFGVGVSIWTARKIRSKVEEVTPLALTKATADSMMVLKDRLVGAIGDARNEISETEAALREEMGLEQKRKPRPSGKS